LGRGRASESKKRKEMRRGRNVDRGEQIFMKSGDRVQGGGKKWTDDGPDKHVIGMLFFEDFSRKKRIGKKAKTA
jgi:hypothetical protein